MIKATAGGGGRGMRLANHEDEFLRLLQQAQQVRRTRLVRPGYVARCLCVRLCEANLASSLVLLPQPNIKICHGQPSPSNMLFLVPDHASLKGVCALSAYGGGVGTTCTLLLACVAGGRGCFRQRQCVPGALCE